MSKCKTALHGVNAKKCSRCNRNKPLVLYYKQERGLYGRAAECKKCRIARTCKWNFDNIDRKRIWEKENRKNRSEYFRAWRKAHPDYFREYYHKRKALNDLPVD